MSRKYRPYVFSPDCRYRENDPENDKTRLLPESSLWCSFEDGLGGAKLKEGD